MVLIPGLTELALWTAVRFGHRRHILGRFLLQHSRRRARVMVKGKCDEWSGNSNKFVLLSSGADCASCKFSLP